MQHDYDGPFDVSGDGSHAITYWSTDVAGNIEAAHSGWVNIDGDAPSSSDASTPALALDSLSGWHNAAQVVTLSAADAGAGAGQRRRLDRVRPRRRRLRAVHGCRSWSARRALTR